MRYSQLEIAPNMGSLEFTCIHSAKILGLLKNMQLIDTWNTNFAVDRPVTIERYLDRYECRYIWTIVHRVSKKQSKLFSSELRQISTNRDNFWHKDGKEAKIIW